MSSKSFTTYAPTEQSFFDINGVKFDLVPNVPGVVILDFFASVSNDDPSSTVQVVHSLFENTVAPHDQARFKEFIANPANNVGLETLMEIAGWVAEILAGAGKAEVPSQPTWPTVG